MEQSSRLRAIIAINTSEISEDWNWFFDDIRKACEGKGIQVVHADSGYQTIRIGPEEQPVAIDLSVYAEFRKGYLFVETGRQYLFQAYDQSDVVLEEASNYFGIELRR